MIHQWSRRSANAKKLPFQLALVAHSYWPSNFLSFLVFLFLSFLSCPLDLFYSDLLLNLLTSTESPSDLHLSYQLPAPRPPKLK